MLTGSAVVLSATLLMSSTALAKDNKSKGATNGQPFLALQQQIDENQAAIAANAADIILLQDDVTEIRSDVSDLQTDLGALDARVSQNETDIADAMARISASEATVMGLQSDLADLAAEHAADFAQISADIEAINARLLVLNDLREQLATELRAELAALRQQVSDNSFAIDSVLLDVLAINAELTSINSDILSIQTTLGNLQDGQDANSDAIADLQEAVEALEAGGGGTGNPFSGIQLNLPVANLNGWAECFRQPYSHRTRTQDITNVCTGARIMLACRQTGSSVLQVAASANREDVFFNTGDRNNIVHNANGVDWYFSSAYSMGFAPQGEGVSRSSADTRNTTSPDRLSWHTGGAGGWRCGANIGLNSSAAFEKIVYQSN